MMSGESFEFLILIVIQVTSSNAFVPDNKALLMDGDLLLGGLFPIHSTAIGKTCEYIQIQDGIQAIEAMKYSIIQINDNPRILENIKLGMIGVDTCESVPFTLDNTLELINRRINNNVNSDKCVCNTSNVITTNTLVGIIGPASSKLSIPVANLLRLFKIPQISYQSTSPELSDRTRFEYFKRTVPSDHYQVKVIADILKHMEYRYVSVVYEDSSYGLNYNAEIERLSMDGEFCIGVSLKLPYNQKSAQSKDIIKTLLKHKNTNGQVVVILILRPGSALKFFQAVKEANEVKTFHWIGTDGWTGRSFSAFSIDTVIEGAVGVQLLDGRIEGFKNYLKRSTNTNPWLKESCPQGNCEEFGILHYISDAVNAFAYALDDMRKSKCGKKGGLCAELKTILTDGTSLLDTLGRVTFLDSTGGYFQFINGSEGPPRYSIMEYSVNNKQEWRSIGNYSCINGEGRVFLYGKMTMSKKSKHSSVCSEPCSSGYAKNMKTRCCWECTRCGSNQYPTTTGCVHCPNGFVVNGNKTNCTQMQIEYVTYTDAGSVVTLLLSAVGITFCVLVIVVFTINRETPLVKATDLKLSLVLIISLMLSYASSLAFLAKPSLVTCGLTRCLLGSCYTLHYATILTKTVRIYRLFEAKSPEKKKFINSRSSITLTLLLTFVHVLGLLGWIIFDRPQTLIKYTESNGILVCADAENFSYAYSLSYSVLLLIACVIFAIKTRKIPDGFKETRFIAICSYTTSIIWLASASTFFSTNNNMIRVLSLCIALSINATVSLVVLFLSRVYIIILKPHLNTRERVMTRANEKSVDRTRSSTCLTANKAVGTHDDEFDGTLPGHTFSEKNNAPFLPENGTRNSPKVINNMKVLKRAKQKDKDTNNSAELLAMNRIPQMTVYDTGLEYKV